MSKLSMLGLSFFVVSLSVGAENSVVQSVNVVKSKSVNVSSEKVAGNKPELTSSVAEVNLYKGELIEPDYVSKTGKFRKRARSGEVEFDLVKGALKPQVIELLLEHQSIDVIDDIQWSASENFQWANSFTAKAPSIDHLLEKIMKPYRLLVTFKGNGSVVIRRAK